jgi:orotate phosphoribosyltransferase-like protein
MKSKHPAFKSKNYESLKDGIDFEAYYELQESGLKDSEIADEMNITEGFLKSIKKQVKEPF